MYSCATEGLMKRGFRVLLIALAVSGCASIEHSSKPQQPVGKQLLAGVGDVVLRIEKQRNLQNAFGKADIFGRKTNEGFTELRFAGVEPNGEVVLYRKDVHILTNETTMSRTPLSFNTGTSNTTVSGSTYGTRNATNLNATAQTSSMSTTVSSPSAYHVAVPSDTIAIRMAPDDQKLPIEGHLVEIIKATSYSLEYKISAREF